MKDLERLENLLKELIESCEEYKARTTSENFKDYVEGRKDGFQFVLDTINMMKIYNHYNH